MNEPPATASQKLNGYEKACLTGLALLHFAGGICFLVAAVYYIHRTIYTSISFWPDFTVYYAAAHMAVHAPQHLYDYDAYLNFYQTIKQGVPKAWFGYLALPSVAVAFAPLSFLSYGNAFLVWSAFNMVFCGLIARESGKLAERFDLKDHTFLFQSLVFGILVTSNILSKGQLSLFMCLGFYYLVRGIDRQRPMTAAFWLAVLMHLKPPLFLPVAFYLAGCRQWRLLSYAAAFGMGILVLTLPVLHGINPWLEYGRAVRLFDETGQAEVYYRAMANLRGILSDLFGAYNHSRALSLACGIAYAAYTLGCFLWPLAKGKQASLYGVCFVLPFGLFFSTYLQIHDTILLLPVCLIITAMMRSCNKLCWMFLCYLLASFESGFATIWCARLLLVILFIMIAYLHRRRAVWRNDFALRGAAV